MLHNGETQEEHETAVDWGPSRTKQSFEGETNINNIIKRFTKTGELVHISRKLGEYRDVSGIPDLHEAMTIVADAQSTFNELPAEIRKLCDHDVAKFLPFIDDPANAEKCVEMGLLPRKSKTVPKVTEAGETVPKVTEAAETVAKTGEADGTVEGGE